MSDPKIFRTASSFGTFVISEDVVQDAIGELQTLAIMLKADMVPEVTACQKIAFAVLQNEMFPPKDSK